MNNPNTSQNNLALWQRFAQPDTEINALLNTAAQLDPKAPSTVTQLRKQYDTPLVNIALSLIIAREKATQKFPKTKALLADPTAVEQATSFDIATHKAQRFATLNPTHLYDLCAGIGGDTFGFAHILKNTSITTVDSDPVRSLMAKHNTKHITSQDIQTLTQDVTTFNFATNQNPNNIAIHLDPARRAGASRKHKYEDYIPGPDFIQQLVDRFPNVAIKLGPGVDFDLLPPGEIELISRNRTLVQAVLWTGQLAKTQRSATMFIQQNNQTQIHTLSPQPDEPTIYDPLPFAKPNPGDILYAVEPTIERAQLMGILCHRFNLKSPHPKLGILVGNTTNPINSPFLTPFQLLEVLPFRLKKLKQALKAHDPNIVTIKPRGVSINPDELQKQLRGSGQNNLTLFIQRLNKKQIAFITKPLT